MKGKCHLLPVGHGHGKLVSILLENCEKAEEVPAPSKFASAKLQTSDMDMFEDWDYGEE